MALTIAGLQVPVVPVATLPPPLNGMGTLTLVAATSTPINSNNLVVAPNSLPFPTGTLPSTLRIKVQPGAPAPVYVFWLGGTAVTTGGGELLAAGEAQTKYLPSQNMTTEPPTVISSGVPQIEIEW